MPIRNVVSSLLLTVTLTAAMADPVVVPPNTPIEADVPVVVVPLEEFKEFIKYVESLSRAAKKCKNWQSEAQAREIPSVALGKED